AFSYTPGDPGLLGIDATIEPAKREPTQDLTLKIVEEIKQEGITTDELAKAKKISLSHHLGALTTMRGQASDLGSNWFLTRNLNFTRDYLDAIQKITSDDIRRVAGKYLVDDNLTVTSLNPKATVAAASETSPAISAGEIQKI